MTDTDIKAGDYELLAQWDEVTSKPTEPLNYERHAPGDIVHLDEATAKRLVGAGAALKKGERARLAGEAAKAEYERALAALPDDVREQVESDTSKRTAAKAS